MAAVAAWSSDEVWAMLVLAGIASGLSLEHIVGVAGPQFGGLRAGLVAAATSGSASLVIDGISCLAGTGLITALSPHLRRFTMTGKSPAPRHA